MYLMSVCSIHVCSSASVFGTYFCLPISMHICCVYIQVCKTRICITLTDSKQNLFTGLVYYNLGNLHPKLRSSLKSIHLLCIARHQLITKYGIDEILTPIIEDIKRLESSVSIHMYIMYIDAWTN